jgi:hypothetical protein
MARHSLLSLRTSMLVRVVKRASYQAPLAPRIPNANTASILVVWNDQAQMRRQSYIGSCCMRLDPVYAGQKR